MTKQIIKTTFNLLISFGLIQSIYFVCLWYFYDDLSSFVSSEKWSSSVSTGLFLLHLVPFIVAFISLLYGLVYYKRHGSSLLIGMIIGSSIALASIKLSINSFFIRQLSLLVGAQKIAIILLFMLFTMIAIYGFKKVREKRPNKPL